MQNIRKRHIIQKQTQKKTLPGKAANRIALLTQQPTTTTKKRPITKTRIYSQSHPNPILNQKSKPHTVQVTVKSTKARSGGLMT